MDDDQLQQGKVALVMGNGRMVNVAVNASPEPRSQAVGCRILLSLPQISAAQCSRERERRARVRGRASEIGNFGVRRRIPSKIGKINFGKNAFPRTRDVLWDVQWQGGDEEGAKSPFLGVPHAKV